MAGERFRCVVRRVFDLRNRVAHGDGEASAAHHGNIRKIVADIRDSRVGYSCFLDNFFIGRHFQWLFHVNKFHIHFMRAPKQGRALPAGDAAGAKASGVRECEPLAVMRVKGFDFEGDLFSLGQKCDTAICHCAVHIHEKHLNLRSTFSE